MPYRLTTADLVLIGSTARAELLYLRAWKAHVESVIAEHRGCNSYDCGDCVGRITEAITEWEVEQFQLEATEKP